MAKLYFVRHALSEDNVKAVFSGSKSDPHLTTAGREQAMAVGAYLTEVTFTNAFVSPQKRALETLELILAAQKQPIEFEVTPKLKEISFGEWDGVEIATKKDHPQRNNLRNNPQYYDPSEFSGESYEELIIRGMEFLQTLTYTSDATYLIVSHGVFLTSLLQILRGRELPQVRQEGLIENASVTVFETDGMHFECQKWNQTVYK